MAIILKKTNRQYDRLLRDLYAHVNNLPLAEKLPQFTKAITQTINDLMSFFIKNPDYLQQFISQDLPQRTNLWLKNIAIYLFLKQKFQMNCVRMNNKCVFVSLNNIYLTCANEDNYYINRFDSKTPAAVEYVFNAIQQFLNQYTRAEFLQIGKDQAVTIDIEDRRYEIIYRTNFFVEGNHICLYDADAQALLDAAQRIDFTGIMNLIFENPLLSGKNFYDLFLLIDIAQKFLMAVLQDQQLSNPLFQDALIINQLDAKKSLRFLATVVTNDLPNLYQLRYLLNAPPGQEWQTYQHDITAHIKQYLLCLIPFDFFITEKSGVLMSQDNWNDNWCALTLMDVLSLPANFVGAHLTPAAQLPVGQIENSDYKISSFLIYKPIPTFISGTSEMIYEPRLLLTTESVRQKCDLSLRPPLEIALPPHLLDFLTKDTRQSLSGWADQMTHWDDLDTTDNTPATAFLNQITVARFFKMTLADQDLSISFSKRLGYYFWRILRKLKTMTNPYIRTLVQGFLKNKMYLADTDMN